MWSRSLEGALVLSDDVGVVIPLPLSHVSLYNSIFIGCFSGFTIGESHVSKYRWSIVSSGWTGNNDGGRIYNSVFFCFRFEALSSSYGCTSKLSFPRSAVIVNGPLAL